MIGALGSSIRGVLDGMVVDSVRVVNLELVD